MSVGGTEIYCPNCKSNQICKAHPPSYLGEGRERRLEIETHSDIHWFRRARECLTCGHAFLTGELDEAFIKELVDLRNAWLHRISGKAKSAARAATKRTRVETVSYEDAHEFVRLTAEWDHPTSWSIVSAPKHADRVYENHLGWAVDFGANTFLVGMAIARGYREMARIMQSLAEGNFVFRENVISRLKLVISGCVANHDGNEFEGYYPLDGAHLTFGTQLINTENGAELLLRWGDPNEILLTKAHQ